MNLPKDFIYNITHSFGEAGERYLVDLPALISSASQRWGLVVGDPFLLSYNYVCAATCLDGTPAVLKIGVPNPELTSEINTLRLYAGQGACLLLESDANAGMLLLERLLPGTMLTTLQDDDQATEIAADLLGTIQRPVPDTTGFLTLEKWFQELDNLRSGFLGTTGPFPAKTVDLVQGLLRDLLAADQPRVLLHGDFHHFNILLSNRGWLIIDPKGVIGPAGYDVGPLLINPMGIKLDPDTASQRTRRRIAILAERLGFSTDYLRSWAICFSLLSAFWDTNPDGTGGEYSSAWTDIFLDTWV